MPFKNPEDKRKHHREYMKRRYHEDPEHRVKQQIRARTKDLPKLDKCQTCGADNPQAHHPDYSKPKEIVWLCRECHLKEHESSV